MNMYTLIKIASIVKHILGQEDKMPIRVLRPAAAASKLLLLLYCFRQHNAEQSITGYLLPARLRALSPCTFAVSRKTGFPACADLALDSDSHRSLVYCAASKARLRRNLLPLHLSLLQAPGPDKLTQTAY